MSSHTCLYYDSKESLLDLVVSFFEQGFRSNELCLWVVPESLDINGARLALSEKIIDLDIYIKAGKLGLLNYKDVYFKSGIFNPDDVLAFWADKEKDALKQGFSGLRVSGDASWIQEKDWEIVNLYEKKVDKLIPKSKMIVLCTYSGKNFDMGKLFLLSFSHDVVIRKEEGKTDILLDKRSILQ